MEEKRSVNFQIIAKNKMNVNIKAPLLISFESVFEFDITV